MNDIPESAQTQREWIHQQLKAGRCLTALDCSLEFGVGRPAARVGELRDSGVRIETELVPVEKANGRKARVGRYRLVGVA